MADTWQWPVRAGCALRTALLVAGVGIALELCQLAFRRPGSVSGEAVQLLLVAYGGIGLAAGAVSALAAPRRLRTTLARTPPALLAVAWLAAGLAAYAATPSRRVPTTPTARAGTPGARTNLVLVTIDSLRADHLGSYGHPRPTSPALDRLATEGVRFAQAISQSSWTKPATASLLTSQFPSTHGAAFEKARLPDEAVLLSEVLHDAGYATGAFSSNPWISAGYGFAQGWDHFWLAPVVRGLRMTLLVSALRRANRLVDAEARFATRVFRRVHRGPAMAARDVMLNQAVFEWLGDAPREPFFLYAHYMSVHHPFEPPPPYDTLFTAAGARSVTDYPSDTPPFSPAPPLPAVDRAELVDRYDGAIRHVDDVVAALVAGLQRRGLLDRTLLVVTADHGEEFYDHDAWGHGQSLYQELLQVPLLMRLPGRLPAGRRVDEVVMSVDVMPTVLRLLGVAPPAEIAGRDLTALVGGTAPGWRGEAYAELLYRDTAAHALLLDGQKLISVQMPRGSRHERYDLAHDPLERHDLGPPPPASAYGARLEALRTWAAAHAARAADVRPGWEDSVRALGYLQ